MKDSQDEPRKIFDWMFETVGFGKMALAFLVLSGILTAVTWPLVRARAPESGGFLYPLLLWFVMFIGVMISAFMGAQLLDEIVQRTGGLRRPCEGCGKKAGLWGSLRQAASARARAAYRASESQVSRVPHPPLLCRACRKEWLATLPFSAAGPLIRSAAELRIFLERLPVGKPWHRPGSDQTTVIGTYPLPRGTRMFWRYLSHPESLSHLPLGRHGIAFNYVVHGESEGPHGGGKPTSLFARVDQMVPGGACSRSSVAYRQRNSAMGRSFLRRRTRSSGSRPTEIDKTIHVA